MWERALSFLGETRRKPGNVTGLFRELERNGSAAAARLQRARNPFLLGIFVFIFFFFTCWYLFLSRANST